MLPLWHHRRSSAITLPSPAITGHPPYSARNPDESRFASIAVSRLFLLFLLTPVAELYLLIQLGRYIGIGPTLALILTTAVIGSTMARREGLTAWQRFQEASAAGRLPGIEIVDGIIILISGACLLTPGVLTDVVGFLGLFPPTRRLIRSQVLRSLKRGVAGGQINIRFGGVPPSRGQATNAPHEAPERPRTTTQPTGTGDRKYETTFGGSATPRPSGSGD